IPSKQVQADFSQSSGLKSAASRVHVEGSSSLLCLASAMFPPVVQFSWKRQKNNGPLEDLTSEEQLDLRESGRSASILLLHQQEDSSYKYICSVKHEGGTVEAQTQQGNEGLVTVFNRDPASCGLFLTLSLFQRFLHFQLQGASTNSRHAE
uniref:Ig-like domain-containing protein n=1 Tax=Oryzias latipes TaxID=8090 RepID=A0A3P9I925_ORYLA